MADMSRDEMLQEINNWFEKIELGVSGVYAEPTIEVGTPYTIDFTSKWPVANYHTYSISVDIKVEDPNDSAKVIPAYNYIDYSISTTGIITFTNNYTAAVKAKIKLSGAVKK